MLQLSLDLSGKPAVFLSNSLRYYNGLSSLAIYRNPPEQAVSLVRLKEGVDLYELKMEGAVNYDRLQIKLRDDARKQLTDLFKKILAYLQMVATEEDIPALMQAGIEVKGRAPRKKTVVAPA
ncbi:hypothetical protein Gbem_2670 [Citrifermentans bemidjiense Bem]|uniref:Uncharacterized protein n=1 Tax=Citrifermentans bemidjiense (strain ATCC BAA-1014 / DSM 16622 / JCM 12645 / Bem) TaxID=404380 RepID=B5EHE2_CITBB|nr:hypothetical protein [Citrifermentans bemidjiense]ACH39678.1 hypothetical protein Gbem_2670 [Citrifermentans bemidjiense Bem]